MTKDDSVLASLEHFADINHLYFLFRARHPSYLLLEIMCSQLQLKKQTKASIQGR